MGRRRIWVVRVTRVCLAAAIVGAILFGGTYVLARRAEGWPDAAALMRDDGVLGLEQVRRGKSLEIRAYLGQVRDLPSVVDELERITAEKAGEPRRLVLVDTRDRFLTDVYYQMHFHIQEATATGAFGSLPEKVGDIAREKGLDSWRIWIRSDRVFVDLRHGGRCLYEVISRTPPGGTRAVDMPGLSTGGGLADAP